MYIAGYLHRQYEINCTFRTKFEAFSDYVNDYYKTKSNAAGWEHVIKLRENDEEEAFKKFYELFYIFINSLNYPAKHGKQGGIPKGAKPQME